MPKDANATVLLDDEEATVNRIAIRIPPFWPDEPELWFAQLEGQFVLSNITDDNVKFAQVLSRIEPKQAREVKDITHPSAQQKYEAIKKTLIQRLSISQEQRIRQLLEHEELGDRKPSQFLRHLSTLAETIVPDDLLRTLWLGRLPTQMQAILTTRIQDRLEDVAEQADRIHEVGSRALVLATSTQPQATSSAWETQTEALRQQVAALTTQMTSLAKNMKRERTRSRSRGRQRDRSRSRTERKKPRQEGVCFYHRRFGSKAKKCTKPCTFKKTKRAIVDGGKRYQPRDSPLFDRQKHKDKIPRRYRLRCQRLPSQQNGRTTTSRGISTLRGERINHHHIRNSDVAT